MKNKRIVLILILSLFLLFPNSSGAKLSKLGTVTMSMVTGTAFMNDSAQSWTGYTSIVGQPKQFKIRVVDTNGYVAIGWIGALGTGETLGDEIVNTWTNDILAPFETFTQGAGTDISLAINTAGGSGGRAYKQYNFTQNALYKLTYNVVVNSDTPPRCGVATNSSNSNTFVFSSSMSGTSVVYRNIYLPDEIYFFLFQGLLRLLAANFSLSGFSLKQVLTPTTNGVWIHPSKTSSTTGWESMQTGFNANSIVSYETISTSVVPGKTHYVYSKNQTGLVGEWSLSSGSKVGSDYSGRGGDDLFTPVGSPTAADGFDGETNGALSFNGTSQYLTQKVYYNETNDDAELTGVLTDGLATAIINDSDSMGTTYDRRGGSSPYMIVATDSGADVAWGYLGVNTFSTPSNTFQIYTTKTGTTQNWNKPTGTFSFANTPITYKIRRTNFQL